MCEYFGFSYNGTKDSYLIRDDAMSSTYRTM